MTRTPDAVHETIREQVAARADALWPGGCTPTPGRCRRSAGRVLPAPTRALAGTAADVLLSRKLRDEAWARHRAV